MFYFDLRCRGCPHKQVYLFLKWPYRVVSVVTLTPIKELGLGSLVSLSHFSFEDVDEQNRKPWMLLVIPSPSPSFSCFFLDLVFRFTMKFKRVTVKTCRM